MAKGHPPFVMSKYPCLADLLKDKAAYYEQLARTIAANVGNSKLSDAEFRQFVGNSISEFSGAGEECRSAPGRGHSREGRQT